MIIRITEQSDEHYKQRIYFYNHPGMCLERTLRHTKDAMNKTRSKKVKQFCKRNAPRARNYIGLVALRLLT